MNKCNGNFIRQKCHFSVNAKKMSMKEERDSNR